LAAPLYQPTSPADYLAFERGSDVKHEFIDGEIVAMSGVSRWHAFIVNNIVVALSLQAKERGCRTVSNDLRVRIPATETYVYPDVLVLCGEGEWLDKTFDTLQDPVFIVEVLSPSTEVRDRSAKFRSYIEIPSLQAYFLVAQDEVMVETYIRQTSATWLFEAYQDLDQTVSVPGLNMALRLADIYDRIQFPQVAE